jgi:micrococcal nuclease
VVLGYVALVAIIVVLVGVIVVLAHGRPESRGASTSVPLPHGVPSGAAEAVVVDHVDGDTIKVRPSAPTRFFSRGDVTTVRLLEIDTPESVDPSEPVQCYARRASAALSRLLPLGAHVWVRSDRDLIDPYGRTLLYLWTARGTFVNLALVRQGFARAVLYEPNDEYIGVMRAAERRAHSADRGLWGACRYFGQPAR